MKFLQYVDIWPGTNNGVLVEKETSEGKVYQATLYKEEYELENFLAGVEHEGINDLDQVELLRKLIEEYGSLQYSRGYDSCEQNMNDC